MNAQRVVVMGLGNLLWADEGFGIRSRSVCMPDITGLKRWKLWTAVRKG